MDTMNFYNGGAARNFNFYSNNNPTLSTTPDLLVSAKYATGDRITEIARYYPKVRKSTGGLKHRRLGYVEVYAISEEYYLKHAMDVDKLKADNKIGIDHNHGFNREVVIESSIPKEFILGYQLFSLPSFNKEWSDSIEKRYGLKKGDYNSYRTKLRNDWDKREETLKEIIIKVTAHQAKKMEAAVKANAAKYRQNENEGNKEKNLNLTSAPSQVEKYNEVRDSNLLIQSKKNTGEENKITSSVTSKGLNKTETQAPDSSEESSLDEAWLQFGILASLQSFKKERHFYKLNTVENFKYIPGNCLFDAIAYQDEKNRDGKNIRKIAIEKIKISNKLLSRINTGINIEKLRCEQGDGSYRNTQQYLALMAKDKTWGTYIEMVALSRALERPIVYLTPNNRYDDILEKERYKDNKPIFLNYVGDNHYEPLQISPGNDCKKIMIDIRNAIAKRKEDADKSAPKEKVAVQLVQKTSSLQKSHIKSGSTSIFPKAEALSPDNA